mgnify:CR=1 FL=1
MAQDKIGGIVRALVGVPQERLVVVQRVINGLNSAAEHGDRFQIDLSKFILDWKPEVEVATTDNPDLLRWSDNYFKLFNQRPDLSQVRIPEKPEDIAPVRLIVVARELIEWTGNHPLEGVQEALKRYFPGWEYDSDLDVAIPTNDRDPRSGSYAVWVKDVQETDLDLANLSAYDLAARGIPGITELERGLFEGDYFFEKNNHLDRQNITLCSGSRDRDGSVPVASWDGGLCVYWCGSSLRDPGLRSRRVWA